MTVDETVVSWVAWMDPGTAESKADVTVVASAGLTVDSSADSKAALMVCYSVELWVVR